MYSDTYTWHTKCYGWCMKLVCRARRGLSVWASGPVACVVYSGRVTRDALPCYVASDRHDARKWVDRAIARVEARAKARRKRKCA